MTQTTSPAPTPSSAFWQRFRDLGSLRRPADRRAVAGVAEGLSRHFDVDPIIVRVLFGALTFFGGAGLILYVALWLTVPNDATGQSVISSRLHRDPEAWTTIGLATGGIFAAAAMLGSLSWAVPHPFPFLLIALIIVLGMVALTRRGDRVPPMPPPYTSSTPPPPPSTGSASASPTAPTDQYLEQSTGLIPATPMATTTTATDTDVQPAADTRAWWQRDDIPPGGDLLPGFAAPPPPPRRPRSHLFGLSMALIALAEALVWIVDATSSYDVNPSVYPGTALAIIAVALLVSTWWGRSRGLIAVGVLASLLTAGAAFAGPGPYGDRSATPTLAAQLRPSYEMGIGRFTLHLEQVSDIRALQGHEVTVNQRFGQLRVVIPSSVAAVVDATVEHGSVDGPAHVQDIGEGGEHVLLSPDPAGRPTVMLHLYVKYGEVRIERAACPLAGPPAAQETRYLWTGDIYGAAACN
jgi:phage shock protein PspC (stress-responsive transcriptional regulator)